MTAATDKSARSSFGVAASTWATAPPVAVRSPIPEEFHLGPFESADAADVSRWAKTAQELRWLAPSTAGPLTAEKVVNWKKPGGFAFVLRSGAHPDAGSALPAAYGELNPMRLQPDHLWIGHLVVRPEQRGRGVGQVMVRALTDHAFCEVSAARVSLIVFPDNVTAIECYRRVGYRIVGEEYHGFGPPQRTPKKHRLLRLEQWAPSG